jgi:hypothetical protein
VICSGSLEGKVNLLYEIFDVTGTVSLRVVVWMGSNRKYCPVYACSTHDVHASCGDQGALTVENVGLLFWAVQSLLIRCGLVTAPDPRFLLHEAHNALTLNSG